MVTVGRHQHNIFVLRTDSLLARGVELLLSKSGLNILPVDVRQPQAVETIEANLQPGDVIIVDKGGTGVHPYMSIFQLFLRHSDIVVIGLDPEANEMELYQRHQKRAKGAKDLLRDDHRLGFQVMSRLIGMVASRLDKTRHVLVSERLASM